MIQQEIIIRNTLDLSPLNSFTIVYNLCVHDSTVFQLDQEHLQLSQNY